MCFNLQEVLSELQQQWKTDLTAAIQKDIDDFLEIMDLLPCTYVRSKLEMVV